MAPGSVLPGAAGRGPESRAFGPGSFPAVSLGRCEGAGQVLAPGPRRGRDKLRRSRRVAEASAAANPAGQLRGCWGRSPLAEPGSQECLIFKKQKASYTVFLLNPEVLARFLMRVIVH